jgi:hypothetical protein
MMGNSFSYHAIFESISQDYALCEQMLNQLKIENFALEHTDCRKSSNFNKIS